MEKKEKKSEGKLKLTKEQEEKVIKKGVVAMTKIIERLEEENEELKEWKENLVRADKKKSDHIDELEEENKKLKMSLEEKDENCYGLAKENKELKEKVETLELWLDNKEKLNEEYRDKIDLLTYQSYGPSELADSLYDANKTIEKLKAELSKYKKQYQHSMGFMEEDTLQELKDIGELEDDELIYEEGLYD